MRPVHPLVAVLLAAAAMIVLPAAAQAVTLKNHITVPHGVTRAAEQEQVVVWRVKPPDADDDGYANGPDECPHESYAGNGGCVPEPEPVITTTAPATSTPAVTESAAAAGSAPLAAIAACESGGDPTAVSPDGTYRGAYQFDYGTWASVGGSGDPAAASMEEQTERASQLYAQSGAAPWPVCGQ